MIYVVYLQGAHVFHEFSVQGYIDTLDDLDRVREKLKSKYQVEFEQDGYNRFGYNRYKVINDDRDIELVVEMVEKI